MKLSRKFVVPDYGCYATMCIHLIYRRLVTLPWTHLQQVCDARCCLQTFVMCYTESDNPSNWSLSVVSKTQRATGDWMQNVTFLFSVYITYFFQFLFCQFVWSRTNTCTVEYFHVLLLSFACDRTISDGDTCQYLMYNKNNMHGTLWGSPMQVKNMTKTQRYVTNTLAYLTNRDLVWFI